MSDKNIQPGEIQWMDLTVENAENIRDFYHAVVGWTPESVNMDGYQDYNMIIPGQKAPTAGICHAKGVNVDLPAQWLIYISVSDLDKSVESCQSMGGKIISGPTAMSAYGRFCVIQDPAGAVAALFEPAQP